MTPSRCKLKRYTELGSGGKVAYNTQSPRGGSGKPDGEVVGREGSGGLDVGYLGITRNCLRDSFINPDQFDTDKFDMDSPK
jgi:hypothetical protein